MPQCRIDSLRILLGLPLRFIDADQLLAAAGIFAKAIVGDPIKPGREARFAAKTANVFVGAEKRFLSKIVGQRDIGAGELPEQTARGGLMATHELAKRMLLIVDKNPGDEVRISKLHGRQITATAAACLSWCRVSIPANSPDRSGTGSVPGSRRHLPNR